ncbi:MAG: FAD-dependent oxidoreductase [Candidatus Aceula meridiana]|nr:FAD-dependent oxidoreductase [Candidatus Aceula meridiana]
MRQPNIPVQTPAKRVKNFHEVELGFSKRQAMEEARRCPQCTNPKCVAGCPLGVDIPGFIRSIREGDFLRALQKVRENNNLAGFCGRLCSAPCEQACILNEEKNVQAIGIRALERFAFDHGQSKVRQIFNAESTNQTNKKVAVVGSGPAGLVVAAQLAEDGHAVTVFETFEKSGGFLNYGVPEFRLPKKVLDNEIDYVKSLGVEIKNLSFIGRTHSIEELFSSGYNAIVLTTGAGIPKPCGLSRQEASGVYFAQEFLMRVNFAGGHLILRPAEPFALGEKVVVLGCGELAVDSARVAVRFGKNVMVVHSSTEEDMKVSQEQKQQAKEEGVRFEILAEPVELCVDEQNHVKGIKCLRLDFADAGEKGEWKLIPVKDSEFIIEADTVILAGESKVNSYIAKLTQGLKVDSQERFYRKKDQAQTSAKNIFAAGAAALGPANFIEVLSDSKNVSNQIDLFLRRDGE